MHPLQKNAYKEFLFQGKTYGYYDISSLFTDLDELQLSTLPFSIKILLEGALRQIDDYTITAEHVHRLANWSMENKSEEVPFKPTRVILQDFTGVPAVLDLASMREALAAKKEYRHLVSKINPLIPVDLIIDHSVSVDSYGKSSSMTENTDLEIKRNATRYEFLNWAKNSFRNFDVVPPANGIVHQINLEYLATVVTSIQTDSSTLLCPDTLVGTDSHTTMINGLGVLGWGVGGIEAEAGMLGQPSYIPIPEVIGVELTGKLASYATATDLALYITKFLRKEGVVGKFVEFTGRAVANLSLSDRATISNMAPEYGATCGYFPPDIETLRYLTLSGRSKEQVELVEEYLKRNQLFQEYDQNTRFTKSLTISLDEITTSLSGPKRPQDLISLEHMQNCFNEALLSPSGNSGYGLSAEEIHKSATIYWNNQTQSKLKTGDIAIAAITSCTNTSNPSVMIAAGLLAKKAVEAGLVVPFHVKTSLAPGSKVVTAYLKEAGLLSYLEKLGFQVIGYGCTTCIGNSGPLLPEIESCIQENSILVSSVLSGNRNFEGRVHPLVKANYLASPPLVVAYALAGTVNCNLIKEPIGYNKEQKPIYLKDIWPTSSEIEATIAKYVRPDVFSNVYATLYQGNSSWNQIKSHSDLLYSFEENSTYIKNPTFFDDFSMAVKEITPLQELRVLAKFGHSITTDHISPAGHINLHSDAANYLSSYGLSPKDFNSYGSRRGNHEVMMRGTFANIRIKNQLAPQTEGGYTTCFLTNTVTTIFAASQIYKNNHVPLLILAGKDYGMGSSRDWAAKGTLLLGVKAVLAQSYERIHRSNLVMMGILPLCFIENESADSLGLTGQEVYTIPIHKDISPGEIIMITAKREDNTFIQFQAIARFDSPIEIDYYKHGGILPMVLRKIVSRFS